MNKSKWGAVILIIMMVVTMPAAIFAQNGGGTEAEIFNGVLPIIDGETQDAIKKEAAGLDGINAPGQSFRPDGTNRQKVFIRFTTPPGLNDISLVKSAGGLVKQRFHLVPAISVELPEQAIANLQRNPRIRLIEPVIKASLIEAYPSGLETLIPAGLYQEELNNTWGVKRIGAGPVHLRGQFGSNIKVAVIDTGINGRHPELSHNYKGGYGFVNNDDHPDDDHGHGTHVAGSIAAQRDGFGVVGVAPQVELYSLKTFGVDGTADYDDILAAIEWAITNGIQVINHSYGSIEDPGTTVAEAFENAYKQGILHVASAGNRGNGTGVGNNVEYPASYPSVIAVGASDENDNLWPYSSIGPAIELLAPGDAIFSTWAWFEYPGHPLYIHASGTSMASPHVAGTAALVWATNPCLTNEQVRQLLRESAENLELTKIQQGYGLVRAEKAVAQAMKTIKQPFCSLILQTQGMGNTVPAAGTYMYPKNETVHLEAIPGEGWIFSHWNGGVLEPYNQTTILIMDNDKTVQAVFREEQETDPEAISLYVVTDGETYFWNSWALITIHAQTPSGNAVPGAGIEVLVEDSKGQLIQTWQGITDATGQAGFRYRVRNKAPTGEYTIIARGTGDQELTEGRGSFRVEEKK